MFNVNYDFQPGDTVFVVIDDTRVEEGTVLTVKFKIYEDDTPAIVTVITYSILLADVGEGTVVLDSSDVFETLDEATDAVQGFLTPTVTPTPTITPTISDTPAVTPTLTPTATLTPTVTPTIPVESALQFRNNDPVQFRNGDPATYR